MASLRAASSSPKPRTDSGLVEEVGAQGRDDADPARRVGGRRADALEHVRAFGLVVDQREQLLELVEHDEQLGVGIGQEPVDRRGPGRARPVRARRAATAAGPRRRRAARVRALGAGGPRGAGRRRTSGRSPGSPRVGSPARGRPAPRRTSPIPRVPPRRGTGRRRSRPAARGAVASAARVRRSRRCRPRGTRAGPCTGCAPRRGSATRAPPPDRPAERGAELEHVGEPRLRILGGRPRDRRVHGGGMSGRFARTEGIGWWRCWSSRTFSDVPGNGCSDGEHLVQHHPERVDVRARATSARA